MNDLAPNILRQRLVIEGTCSTPIVEQQIKNYLKQLSEVTEMIVLIDPVTHQSPKFGWAGWIHWETSGAHFYVWDNPVFFSVDVYTCKAFNVQKAVDFTKEFFDAQEIEFKSF